MAKVGVSESWITTGNLKSSGRAGIADRYGRVCGWNRRRRRPRPVFYRCHHHSLARTRLLVWPGDRVPSPGNRRAGDASGFKLKKAILIQLSIQSRQTEHGFPVLAASPGQFLVKNVVLLEAATWTPGRFSEICR